MPGDRNRLRILLPLKNLQAGIAVSACRAGCTCRAPRDGRSRLQPWVVSHCHADGIRQGERGASRRRIGSYTAGYLGKRRFGNGVRCLLLERGNDRQGLPRR